MTAQGQTLRELLTSMKKATFCDDNDNVKTGKKWLKSSPLKGGLLDCEAVIKDLTVYLKNYQGKLTQVLRRIT